MIFNIYFDFFFDAKSAQGKENTLKKINQVLVHKYSVESVNYIEGSKYLVTFESDAWEELVFKLIEFSQTIGQQWVITGSIDFEFNLWSNHSKIVGVSTIGISTDNIVITES